MHYETSSSMADARKARADFNIFMNGVVKAGTLSVEHIRLGVRQPETETFARKAVAALDKLATATRVLAKYVELESSTSGPAGLAEAVALFMESRPALARFLGEPDSVPSLQASELMNTDLFAILNAYSRYEVLTMYSAAPSFSSGAVSVVGKITSVTDRAPADVMAAADSVFAQSFADVHAITLCAAFDGNLAGLRMVKDVLAIRDAGGDFGSFTLAPLSHDSRTAIEILRSQLTQATSDFTTMSRQELWDNSRWAAAEGVAAWMQSHGVAYRDASSMTSGLEAVGQVVAHASHRTQPGVGNRTGSRQAV